MSGRDPGDRLLAAISAELHDGMAVDAMATMLGVLALHMHTPEYRDRLLRALGRPIPKEPEWPYDTTNRSEG